MGNLYRKNEAKKEICNKLHPEMVNNITSCNIPNLGLELCFKQPNYNLSCGPGATLLMLTHFLLRNSSFLLKESFWNWYARSSFLNQTKVMEAIQSHTNINSLGYSVQGEYFNDHNTLDRIEKNEGIRYTPIENFKRHLLDLLMKVQIISKSPMIISITNHVLEGHWIVIDRINNNTVSIRDPYSGNAYEISHEEMFENWKAEDEVKVIYLTTETKPSGERKKE